MNVVRAFLKWTFGAWLATVEAFSLMTLVSPNGREDLLGELVATVMLVGIFSLIFIGPAALGAVVLEWLFAARVSRLILGAAAGFLAMSWTLAPSMILMATVAGATAGLVGDRELPVLSARWFAIIALGGLLMCTAGFLISLVGVR